MKRRQYTHTPAQIAKQLRVDEDGKLWWKISRSRRNMNEAAGYVRPSGYRFVGIDKEYYTASHLVWCLTHGRWPCEDTIIDHMNRKRDDNTPSNLREISGAANQGNRGISRNNTSGHSGVTYVGPDWRAYIYIGDKKHDLGRHHTFNNAVIARRKAEIALGRNT